ncbi:LptF/LptG family permease [Campylobacter sp. MIT 21-1685]|uniref:LptF/LptG family permease n=1 Tax=unclassified Campylobacter TaxID=2593542 RepID=UPI00224B2930|nr:MULTISPECIES: LptF/LptG family permease [unclassified Campylobacter]MCX2683032.1 LptF/LptG family permease [Campylobacter sp. MIT 21-1684]MCX2751314.1 LptF/LptG family permease [Campylobacter sp. MIT 21-1682]MCX2807513.1 LptF/LptG family permease [Campylobacter sp. MIT 21-1685]
MWILFRFLSGLYLKNFFIIFFSLLSFYIGIDLLVNFNSLPHSANLTLLYIFFLMCSAIAYVLPLSLVFAFVLAFISMIRANELVSLYALGLSKNKVIFFPFLWAVFFCFVFIGLNFTSFAYASQYKSSIIRNGTLIKQSGEAFLKLNDDFVYIQKIENGQNALKEVTIFHIKEGNLTSFTKAQKAEFKDNAWFLENGSVSMLPQEYKLGATGLERNEFENIQSLKDFKPKIIENLANQSGYSLSDIFESFKVLRAQNINTDNLKIVLYKFVIMPFFAPFVMLILYFFFPVISRFVNLAFVAFTSFVILLLVWGMLFLLSRLSENGVLQAELGIILPIIVLAFYSGFLSYKHR